MDANKGILVTGAAGGVGRTICRMLTERGIQVRGLVRPEDDVDGLCVNQDQLVKGYVEDPDAVARALPGVEAVIHCAALLPCHLHLGPEAFHRVNVLGPLNVLQQAAKQRVSRIALFSTISVVDHVTKKITQESIRQYIEKPDDPYLASKINLEKAVHEKSRSFPGEIAILRPAFIYGPGNYSVWKHALELLGRGKMAVIGKGDAPLPLIHAEDIGHFILRWLRQPVQGPAPAIYSLASHEPTTIKQVFDFIADYQGVRRPAALPYWPMRLAAALVEVLPRGVRVGRLKLLTRARVLQFSRGYDLSGVINPPPLGFVARTGYRAGLAAMLDDYRSRTGSFPRTQAARSDMFDVERRQELIDDSSHHWSEWPRRRSPGKGVIGGGPQGAGAGAPQQHDAGPDGPGGGAGLR